MSMAVVGIAGGAAVLGGAYLQSQGAANAAKSQNRAAKDAQQLFDIEQARGKVQQLFASMGSERATQLLRTYLGAEQYNALFGRGGSVKQKTAYENRINQLTTNLKQVDRRSPEYQRMVNEKAQLQMELKNMPATGVLDLEDLQSAHQGGGYIGELEGIAKDSSAQGQKLLGEYGEETKRLAGIDKNNLDNARFQNTQLYGMVDKYGKGRQEQIDREYQKTLTDQNDQSAAELIGSGLGSSTLLTNATSANRRRLGEVKSDAEQRLADAKLQASTGVRQWGMGREDQLFGAAQQNAYGRSTGQTSLGADLISRNAGLAAIGPQARANLESSASFNPYLGVNTTQFFPGLSPQAAFMTNFGSGLTAAGGTAVGAAAGLYGRGGGTGGGGGGGGNAAGTRTNFNLWGGNQQGMYQAGGG